MRLLLDTHVFLWWLDGDRRLSAKVRRLVADEANEIVVSAVSAFEITTKTRIGKLPGAYVVAADVGICIASQGFVAMPISIEHAERAGRLPGPHRDPFDRLLIAQSQAEGIPIVSVDDAFDAYGLTRIW